jgi:hypothetical protein
MYFAMYPVADPEEVELATDIFHEYALQVDGSEPGAAQYRFTAKPIDEVRRSVVVWFGYTETKCADAFPSPFGAYT